MKTTHALAIALLASGSLLACGSDDATSTGASPADTGVPDSAVHPDASGDANDDASVDSHPSDTGSADTVRPMDSRADAMDSAVDSVAPADTGSDSAPDSATDADADAQTDANTEPEAATPCDPVAQTGCAPGDKCTVDFSAATLAPACVPNGAVANGGACITTPDNCMAPGVCTSDGQMFLCHDFCQSDIDCTQPAVAVGATAEPNNKAYCWFTFPGGYKLCTYACNPVHTAGASGCPAGQGCYLNAAPTIGEFTDCQTEGTSGTGATCTSDADCKGGFLCVDTGAAQHSCLAICRNGGQYNDCAASETCNELISEPGAMFGVCL